LLVTRDAQHIFDISDRHIGGPMMTIVSVFGASQSKWLLLPAVYEGHLLTNRASIDERKKGVLAPS